MAGAVVEADAVLADIEIIAHLEYAHGVVDSCSPDALFILAMLSST